MNQKSPHVISHDVDQSLIPWGIRLNMARLKICVVFL
jgi:hypothetical protein